MAMRQKKEDRRGRSEARRNRSRISEQETIVLFLLGQKKRGMEEGKKEGRMDGKATDKRGSHVFCGAMRRGEGTHKVQEKKGE